MRATTLVTTITVPFRIQVAKREAKCAVYMELMMIIQMYLKD